MEGIAKNDLSQKSGFMDFGIDLCRFLEALGTVFLIFAAPETGLIID